MPTRFSPDQRRVVLVAAEEASRRRRDPRLGTEHLLVGVAEVGDPVGEEFHLSPERIRDALDARDARALQAVGIEADIRKLREHPPLRRRRWLGPRGHVPFTTGAKKALERSAHIAIGQGDRRIGTTHLLAALVVGPSRDPAVRALRDLGLDPTEIDRAIHRTWRATGC